MQSIKKLDDVVLKKRRVSGDLILFKSVILEQPTFYVAVDPEGLESGSCQQRAVAYYPWNLVYSELWLGCWHLWCGTADSPFEL